MDELTEAQREELRGYVANHGAAVVTCVALSMLAENGYTGDVWPVVERIEQEVGDGV